MLLELQIIPRQEQKHALRQVQIQLVRCLIVHYRTDTGPIECALPIKPGVSTRRAKKTGYEYIEREQSRVHNDCTMAIVAAHALGVPVVPDELKDIVQITA